MTVFIMKQNVQSAKDFLVNVVNWMKKLKNWKKLNGSEKSGEGNET